MTRLAHEQSKCVNVLLNTYKRVGNVGKLPVPISIYAVGSRLESSQANAQNVFNLVDVVYVEHEWEQESERDFLYLR